MLNLLSSCLDSPYHGAPLQHYFWLQLNQIIVASWPLAGGIGLYVIFICHVSFIWFRHKPAPWTMGLQQPEVQWFAEGLGVDGS